MSKVSHKNELLPSFEPIEQQKAQKRKRSSVLNGGGNSHHQPVTKKSKAKKNSLTTRSTNTIGPNNIWIGATLMQQQEEKEISAAFSVYYGLNDDRNFTEKIAIQQNQNLDHVYTMGVIRALDNSKDSSSLLIHTGSKILQSAMDDEEGNEFCNQIKEKISKRNGSTSICYKTSSNKQDEYQVAHNLANEKLLEDNMMVDEEATVVDSLEVTHKFTSTIVNDKEQVVTIIEEKEEVITVVEPLPSPSWAKILGLRNLLDVLKAPFYRNKQK